MPDLPTQTFDWLSDLSPVYNAMESWRKGLYQEDSLFHLVFYPDGPFSISSGAGLLADHIRRFQFSPEIIRTLGQVTDVKGRCVFDESFLNHLQRLQLRIRLLAPPEGMLLLPGEPLAILRGPYDQIQLMESALRWLVWRSTQWTTWAALSRWEREAWTEEDTPSSPVLTQNPDGWKIRAEYIGGALADDILDSIRRPSRLPNENEGLICLWRASEGSIRDVQAITQVRRVYKGNHALGDIWLNDVLEEKASVSRTSAQIHDLRTHRRKTLKFTRFQNLYQPLLVKGHPVLASPRLGYLRQRTLKQLEAFHFGKIGDYPHGWMDDQDE